MKKTSRFLIPMVMIAALLASASAFAGQEIVIPYALTVDKWESGLAITNLSDEEIDQLAIDFYPSDGDFQLERDRRVIDSIGARAMVVEQASNLYPGESFPTGQYSLRIFHNGDQPFGAAVFVLNMIQGFGLQQFKSEEFESVSGDGSALMLIHASPDAPAVDVRVDAFTVASELAYPENTNYLDVETGDRYVQIFASGTDTAVFQDTLAIAENTTYSIFAANEAASLELLILEDDLTAPAAGNAHVRFIHLSPDAPAVDVTLEDGTVVFGDYEFKEASEFTPVAAGTVDLKVRAAGTSTVVLDVGHVNLVDGTIYTIFARGFLTGTGTQALGAEVIVNK